MLEIVNIKLSGVFLEGYGPEFYIFLLLDKIYISTG